MATQSACSDFEMEGGDAEINNLCRCPKCGGYLPRDFPIGEQFICKKCGAVLETMPGKKDDHDIKPPKKDPYLYGGRICIVPGYAVKIDATLPPKVKKPIKKRTNLWAMGKGFIRRVFEDGDGKRFIELYEKETDSFEKTKIELSDPRILKTVEDPEV